MSALPHRHFHLPRLAWVRAHPTRAFLAAGFAASIVVVATAWVGVVLGHLEARQAFLVFVGVVFLFAVATVWRGLQLGEKDLKEQTEVIALELKAAAPISVDSAYRLKHLDEPTAQYPVVKKTSTVYNVGHPADDKVKLGLMRDAEIPTGEIRI